MSDMVSVRAATESDNEGIVAVDPQAPLWEMEEGGWFGGKWHEDIVRPMRRLIAEVNGRPVACLTWRVHLGARAFQVLSVSVLPVDRGRGITRHMLRRVTRTFTSWKAKHAPDCLWSHVEAVVDERDLGAQKFFAHLGWRVHLDRGGFKDSHGEHDAVVFVWQAWA